MSGISILVPCFNEAGNINLLFGRIQNAITNTPFEVVFIDDGSIDETNQEILKLQKSNPSKIRLVTHLKNEGIPASWSSGLTSCSYDLVCLIDGDLQNPPEAISTLLNALNEFQVDVVQAVRSSIGRVKNSRLILSRGLNCLLNLTFSQKAKDSKSGFLVTSKEILEEILADSPRFRNFQTFIGVALRAKGFRIAEVETLFLSREIGESFLTRKRVVSVLFSTLRDLIVGLKIYGRSITPYELNVESRNVELRLSKFRKVRFNLYFWTMPIHKWIIGKDSRKMYYWLKKTEFADRRDLQELQLRRLKRLLQHAYLNVPYYKNIFDSVGFKPSELDSLEDLARIPLLSKQDVRKNVYFSLFSRDHNKKQMLKISTSGSTGEPFICYADKFQLEMRFATTLRALEMTGWKFGDRQLRLWHQTLGMSRSQAIKEKIDAWFMNRRFVPAFELTENHLNELMKTIEKVKPVLIDGYAESLNFIARASELPSKHKPAAIMSSAQQLTAETRQSIETKFGSKVYDKYGSREFSGIAYQCEHSLNHHVQDESYIVEILVDGRSAKIGEVGEIVITDLNNYSMPLIRYRIGDMAEVVEQSDCPCGRKHSMIGEITGRTQALVLCANGVWLPGTFFAHFFKDYEFAIKHYQIVQISAGSFTVKIVPKYEITQDLVEEIIYELRKYSGANNEISVDIVDEIPLLKTGKRTPVVSTIRQDFQRISSESIWKRYS